MMNIRKTLISHLACGLMQTYDLDYGEAYKQAEQASLVQLIQHYRVCPPQPKSASQHYEVWARLPVNDAALQVEIHTAEDPVALLVEWAWQIVEDNPRAELLFEEGKKSCELRSKGMDYMIYLRHAGPPLMSRAASYAG